MKKRQPGPIRIMVDSIAKMARVSGLSIESCADFMDALAVIQKEYAQPSTDEPVDLSASKTIQ